MHLLACGNSMIDELPGQPFTMPSIRIEAVGDLAPAGVLAAAFALHLARHRNLSLRDQSLVLVLGALVGAVVGALLGFKFQVSVIGVSTAPLFFMAVTGLRAQAETLRPRAMARRYWPIDIEHEKRKRSGGPALPHVSASRRTASRAG